MPSHAPTTVLDLSRGIWLASLAALRQISANLRAGFQRAEKNVLESVSSAKHAIIQSERKMTEVTRRLAARAGIADRTMSPEIAAEIFEPIPAGTSLEARLDELLKATSPSPYLRCKVAQAYLCLQKQRVPP